VVPLPYLTVISVSMDRIIIVTVIMTVNENAAGIIISAALQIPALDDSRIE
jgi:hypothetical protein